MARAARLAHGLGSDIDLLLVTNDKVLVDVTTSDAPDESSLFRRDGEQLASPLAWSYWFVRVLERLLSYLVFIGLVAFSFAISIREIVAAFPTWRETPLLTTFFVGAVSLTAVAILRVCQYWLIRVEGFFAWRNREAADSVGLPFFHRYSLTIILGFIGFLLWALIVGILVRATFKLILRPWRSAALEIVEQDRVYNEDLIRWYRLRPYSSAPRPSRPQRSVRERILGFAFASFP